MDYQTNNTSSQLLDICCNEATKKFGKPDITKWTNRDYLFFSNDLLKKTGVQISASTLKRIFGKLKTAEKYYPQKATLEALAQYLDFSDWNAFVEAHKIRVEEKPAVITSEIATKEKETKPIRQRKKGVKLYWVLIITAILLTTIFIITLEIQKHSAFPLPGTVQLVCKNPEGKTPHSAIFSMEINGNKTYEEQFKVSFGDGEASKTMQPGSTVSHYYEVPGRYYAYLQYNGKVIDTVAVYLRSDGWTATATTPRDTTRVYPIRINASHRDSLLYVSTDRLLHAGIDTNYTFFVNFVNSQPYNISADNFEITTQLSTSTDRAGVRCAPLYMYIFGEKSLHYFYIHKQGCESWIQARFSEWAKNGEEDDMRDFTADLSKGAVLKLRVENKNVSIWIDGKKIFNTKYKIPLGRFYGTNICFAGIGAVQTVTLLNLADQSITKLLP